MSGLARPVGPRPIAEESPNAMDAPRDVSALLADWRGGDAGAMDRLLPLVYHELRSIAHRQLLSERPGHTLSTTALVHEAYVKLVDQTRAQWTDQAHFLAVAARAMRRILVDYARKRQAAKRGGPQQPVTLEESAVMAEDRADALVALDEALTRLATLDERMGQVVECRFFGGLTEEETASALQVTSRTVRRDWAKAKGWLYQELREGGETA